MCYRCWEEEDCPRIDNPLVRASAQSVAAVYEFCPVGGNLHIAVDDWNVEDGNLDFCEGCIDANEDGDPPDQLAAERYCLGLLRSLTEVERYSALALHDGFWTPEPAA